MPSSIVLLGTPMSIPLVPGLFMRRVPSWSAMAAIVSGLCVSAAAFVCGRFGHPWDFTTTMRTPVDYPTEVGRETDLGQLSVIGLFTITLGLLVDGLLILRDDLRGVLGVSPFIITVGAGLFLVGWRRGNTREIP